MKNFFKVLTLGLLLAVFTAVNVTTTFAQGSDEQAEKTAIYNKFLENYKGNIEQRKSAIEAAKEYIEKWGNSEADAEQIKYFKGAIPQLEKGIKDEIAANEARQKAKAKEARYAAFDKAARAADWDQTYAVGKQILAEEPELIDVVLVLGSIGLDESTKETPVKKFNNDTITYAKIAIDKLNAGAKSTNFGAYGKYEYKTKENALGWMNWTIGNLLYFHMDKEQDALPYLYKASQYNSDVKELPEIYRAIGRWYLNKVVAMEKVRTDKIAANENQDNEETLALLAQNKGYAARAIDAYARAYSLAKANPKAPKEYKDSLFSKLQELYKFRYDEEAMKTDAKINADVATIMNKPMPNPTSPVEPVETPKPSVETTETTTTGAVKTNGAERNRTVVNNTTTTVSKPSTTNKANTVNKPKPNNKPRKR